MGSWISGHRWPISITLGVIIFLAVGVGLLWVLVFRNRAIPVTVADALRNYRQQRADPPPAAASELPRVGVYAYDTTGFEQLNIAGTRRSWPSVTAITVTDQGCGVNLQWDALAEHQEDNGLCASSGSGPGSDQALLWESSSSTVGFFGLVTHQELSCDPGSVLRPATNTSGQHWSFECRSVGDIWRVSADTVGVENVTVGRAKVPALHVRLAIAISGSETGTSPTDYWFALDGSEIVKAESVTDVSQGSSPFGAVRYHDEYRLELTSVTPLT
jgi:hypothetical protein